MTFNIDDQVFIADFSRREKWVACPDCGGTKKMLVTLFDGSTYDIQCGGCSLGYNPPSGVIKQFEWSATATPATISSIEINKGGVNHYGFAGSGRVDYDNRTFATEAEAMAKANELKGEYEAEENKRYMAKTKDHRSWAWHVSYHRSCIKDCERKLEYHTKMLGVSKVKSGAEKQEAVK